MNIRTFIDLQTLLNIPHNCATSLVLKEFGLRQKDLLTAVGNTSIRGVGTKLGTVLFLTSSSTIGAGGGLEVLRRAQARLGLRPRSRGSPSTARVYLAYGGVGEESQQHRDLFDDLVPRNRNCSDREATPALVAREDSDGTPIAPRNSPPLVVRR
jgi:hypothetical protein